MVKTKMAARECVLPAQFTPLRNERYTGVLRDLRLARLLIILSKSFTNLSSTLPIELITYVVLQLNHCGLLYQMK